MGVHALGRGGFRAHHPGVHHAAERKVRLIDGPGPLLFFFIGLGQRQIAAQHGAVHLLLRKIPLDAGGQLFRQQGGRVAHGKALQRFAQRKMCAGKALGPGKAEPLGQRAFGRIVQPDANVHAHPSL